MPLTPFHLGGGLFLGSLNQRFFNLWVLLLASALPDLEPFYLIFAKRCYTCPHHDFFHSILGAFLGSLILALILYGLRDVLKKTLINVFKYKSFHSYSFGILFASSLAGWLLHVFFDSLTHFDVSPFWPSKLNPLLLDPGTYWLLSFFLLVLGIIGLLRILKEAKK